jgi:multidrug transporter EmrE-like cation transporter
MGSAIVTPSTSGFIAYSAMFAVVFGNVTGNVLMKAGGSVEPNRTILFGIIAWQTLAGIAFFASSIVLYAWVLRQLPLYIAQAIASLQFVGATLAAAILFGESIAPGKWFGVGLIVSGLIVIASY